MTPYKSENINLSSFGSSQPLYRQMDSVIVHIKTWKGELLPLLRLVQGWRNRFQGGLVGVILMRDVVKGGVSGGSDDCRSK